MVKWNDEWCRKVWFEVRDRIMRQPDGTYREQTGTDDWSFSRKLHKLGRKIVGTKVVKAAHVGNKEWPNWAVWGQARDVNAFPVQWFGEDEPHDPEQIQQPAGPVQVSMIDAEGRIVDDPKESKGDKGTMNEHEFALKMLDSAKEAHAKELTAARQQHTDNYAALMHVIRRIKEGDVNPTAVALDFDKLTWQINAPTCDTAEDAVKAPWIVRTFDQQGGYEDNTFHEKVDAVAYRDSQEELGRTCMIIGPGAGNPRPAGIAQPAETDSYDGPLGRPIRLEPTLTGARRVFSAPDNGNGDHEPI
jgi:hypothetical protein